MKNASILTNLDKTYHLDRNFTMNPISFGNNKLFQIGRYYCNSKTVINEHSHMNWFEITIATGGKGFVYTNGIAVPIKRGDIFLSFPFDLHSITPDPIDPLKYDFFSFNTSDERLSKDLEKIMESHIPADCRIISDETISALVGNAISELDTDDEYSNDAISAIITHIIVRIIRGFLYKTPIESRPSVTEPVALCYRLMNYIDSHIYSMTSLEELSTATNYNYSYLSALFHKTTSGTLTEYYRNRRLETARHLLIENKLKITDIAVLLHYSSIYTFSRAFKDQYGISPEKYRKREQSQQSNG